MHGTIRGGALVIRFVGALAALALTGACGSVRLGTRDTPTPAPVQPAPARAAGPNVDPVDFLRRHGRIAHGAPFPFSGSVGYLASARDDSTDMMVALSFATASLRFRSDGDQYRADYRVTLTVRRGEASVARVEAAQPLRVATLRETHRSDESVLFQQLVARAPGSYALTIALRDDASGITVSEDVALQVPALRDGTLSTPIACYQAAPRASRDSLPAFVVNPQAVATMGRDSAITICAEHYGPPSGVLQAAAQVEGQVVWRDSVALAATAGVSSATLNVPVSRLGPGVGSVQLWTGASDTVRTPVFVSIGDELPVTSYEDMVGYLRYFVSAERLRQLLSVPPAGRGTAWTAFLHETDTIPSTPENEALDEYLARVRRANERYGDARTPGWKTDRGMVLLLLGDPDQVLEQGTNDVSQRARSQMWEYTALGLTVEFVFSPQLNEWRLTPASDAQVRAYARRRIGT